MFKDGIYTIALKPAGVANAGPTGAPVYNEIDLPRVTVLVLFERGPSCSQLSAPRQVEKKIFFAPRPDSEVDQTYRSLGHCI